jgi:hypothetical protein
LLSFVDPDPYFFKCTQDFLEAYIVKWRFSTTWALGATFLVIVKNLKIQENFHEGANLKFDIPEFFSFELLIPEYSPIELLVPNCRILFLQCILSKNNKTVKTIVCF